MTKPWQSPSALASEAAVGQPVAAAQAKGSLKTVAAHTAVALVCNACCWAPPLVIAITGASTGFLSFFDRYRLLMTVITAIQLAVGFYLAYRKPKPACETHSASDHAHMRTLNIRIMWFIAVVVVALNIRELFHHHVL